MARFDVDSALECGRGLLDKETNPKHAELLKMAIASFERLKAKHGI